jgi:hypothetical protein
MVALLGSGVVLLRADGSEVQAQGNPCENVKPATSTVTTGGTARTVLVGDPCCMEGLQAFFGGYDNMADPQKAHLRDFADALQSNKTQLLEYCVMVWGLTKADSSKLLNSLKETYRLKDYTAPAKK